MKPAPPVTRRCMNRTLGPPRAAGSYDRRTPAPVRFHVMPGRLSALARHGQVTSVTGVVDSRADIRDFLASRRSRITPAAAGLPSHAGHRRVPGLRREEVALLAGVSVEYYTRLEQGDLKGVPESVLEALAGALRLDEADRT